MSQQQQVKSKTKEASETPVEPMPQEQTKNERLKADIDDILDEIDCVLMENAEQMVSEYRQMGGE